MDRVRGQRASALLVVAWVCALASACRERPGGETSLDARVTKAMGQIESTLGVKFKTRPRLEFRTPDSIRAFLMRQFDKAKAREQFVGEEAAYKAFGLIPDTMNLRAEYLAVYGEQVAGIYDPETKLLYVRQGLPDEMVGLTIPHELVHALQGQYANLDSILKSAPTDDDDRAAAIQAVVEGQAHYVNLLVAAGGAENLASRLPGGWDQLRESTRENLSAQPQFSAAPRVIQETMLFPYLSGAEFARNYAQRHPGTMPLEHLPVSTEQIMHVPAFFGPVRDDPTPVKLPSVAGTIYSNNLGEFGVRLFLFQHLHDSNAAVRAALGWDGDRYVIYRAPGGVAVAWASVWDTPVDAAEFVTATVDAMQVRYRGTAKSEGDARVVTGQGRIVRLVQREIDGRDVVLFTDVPAVAASTAPDIGRVRLGP
jgi:hypothetical protein